MRVGWRFLVLVGMTLAVGCGTDALCERAELESALADASSGDTVEVGECRVTGAFVVPAGVTLKGAGVGKSTLVADPGTVGVTLASGTSAARVRGLTIESAGRVGVLATGDGAAAVEDVAVVASRGLGLAADGLASLELARVDVRGPVTAANAAQIPSEPDPAATGTHGVVLVQVEQATATDLRVSGFAFVGVVSFQSTLSWTGGGADANLGTGAMIYGGTATLDGVTVNGTLAGERLSPAYGVVVASEATVDTRALEVRDGEGLGVLQAGGSATHEGLVAAGNADVGVWAQLGAQLELRQGEIVGNRYAGIAALGVTDLSVSGSTIDDTVLGTTVGETGAVEVGDGIQVSAVADSIALADLSLAGNGRVGVLLDLEESTATLALDSVRVEGDAEALGCIAQGGAETPEDWDTGVTREGATAANDEAFLASGARLGLVGLIGPNSIPEAEALEESLRGLIGPNS